MSWVPACHCLINKTTSPSAHTEGLGLPNVTQVNICGLGGKAVNTCGLGGKAVHTQAPSRALGAARCPRIVGLPSSRSAGAKEGSSLCKGPSDTEKQGHWQRWGGSIQGRGWGSGHASPWGWAPGRGTGQGPGAGSCVPGSPGAGPGAEQTPWRAQGLLAPWVLSPG